VAESHEKLVQTTCPRCGSHIETPAASVGHRMICPKCGHEVKMLHGASLPPLRGSQAYVAPPASDDEYALRDATYAVREPPPGEHSGPVSPGAEAPDEFAAQEHSAAGAFSADAALLPDKVESTPRAERPKLPPHPMVNGVLAFFFAVGGAVCWAGLSLGATFVCLLAWQAVRAAGMGGSAGTTAGAWLQGGAPLIASLLYTILAVALGCIWLVVASGNLLAVLQDSAAGNRVVLDWPDLNFIEWVGGTFYIVVSCLIPVGAVYLLAWPLGGVNSHGWLMPIGLWLLFPLALLSTLETQSPLVPVSSIVLESLWKCGRAWLVFYIETCLIGLGVALVVAVVSRMARNATGVALVAGTGVAAAMLYFRLLGRLAWVCDEHFRQESAEEENEDEEEDDEPTPGADDPPIRTTPINDF